MNIEIIGSIAGAIGVLQSVPQIHKVYTTKSAKDISYITMIMLLFCLSLWMYYGHVKEAPSILISNAILLSLYILLLGLKIKYDNPTKRQG